MDISHAQQRVKEITEGIEHPRVGAALALAEECGEVMRCVLDGEYYGKDNREALADELGDVFVCLLEMCDRNGLSMDACAEAALEKLAAKAPGWKADLGDRLADLRSRMDGPPG